MITKDTIGVAFLGVGRMGETHLRNLAAISGIRVIAVADLVQERAEHGRTMTGAELAMTDSLKPIALTLAETQRVVDLVRDRKSLVQVGFMRRFDPGYAKAKAKIDAGELGKLETFRALSRDTYPPSLEYLLGSGGLFLDMSVHDLDLARFLVGEVEQVSAWASVLIDERFAKANDADTAVTLL